MIALWLTGLLRRRTGRVLGAATGIAVAVALTAVLGAFLVQSRSTMTDRAIAYVAVDWQVQLQPGVPENTVSSLLTTAGGVRDHAAVGYAGATSLTAQSGNATFTTGSAVVLGIPENYRTLFPGQIRTLNGTDSGVLLAQQTASNLHLGPGDTLTLTRDGLPPTSLAVTAVVDLPQANSLFQTVGAPPQSQPAAPPDNVVILPSMMWHQIFDPLAQRRPDLVSTQLHVERDHNLPPDPAAAYVVDAAAARNIEARTAGGARVGDNLGAALDAARQDAAYAQILFLFLGAPGIVLAAALTATVVSSSALRRRAEQSLLRARGATGTQILRLAISEAALTAALGITIGLGVGAAVARFSFGPAALDMATSLAEVWVGGAAALGTVVALLTIALPAYLDHRRRTVRSGRTEPTIPRYPVWARYGTDFVCLAASGLIFRATGSNGYQLVLAPEGVAAISVSYWALAAPALLWTGAALLTWRLVDAFLGRGSGLLTRLLSPFTGRINTLVAHSLSRQRRPLTRAIVALSLALAFAASTATFGATYARQAEADAQLTNGSDVTVTPVSGSRPATATTETQRALASIDGVGAVEPIQHRFAYIGSDLQDLFGVRPNTIATATALQDAYFEGGTAADLLATLAVDPTSILVSAETVKDFQLTLGDSLTLKMPRRGNDALADVKFRYAGVVTEFPTAPKDSFFVANSDYIARQTGYADVGAYLVDTHGVDQGAVAAEIASTFGSTVHVSDIASVRGAVGSSLTSVDLRRLTQVELAFAFVLAIAAGGLVFALSLAERQRMFAIASALGATRRHLAGFVLSEAGVLTVCGVIAGAGTSAAVSLMSVKVLTGVFDPPPSVIAIPWLYLGAVTAVSGAAIVGVALAAVRRLRRTPVSVLRDQ